MVMLRAVFVLVIGFACVLAQDEDPFTSDPAVVTEQEDADAPLNAPPPPEESTPTTAKPEDAESGISAALNANAPPSGPQTEEASAGGKDMVCVCKRIKKPQNVKCNRTIEIEEPPQDPKTLKELVQCTPGGYNLTQAQRLLLRREARARQEMEAAQEQFEVDQVHMMSSCLSGHCKPDHDLNSASFWTPPKPIQPMACYDRCQESNCKPIWRNPSQGWEDWYSCVQQCVAGCYIIVDH